MFPEDPKRRGKDRLILIVIFVVVAVVALFVTLRILAWKGGQIG